MIDHDLVANLVYKEAHLLDNKQLDDWLDLLTPDILYWCPLKRGQLEDEVYNSLFYEDLLLLRVRIERLKSPRVFSQQPPSFSQHVLQQPFVEEINDQHAKTRTPFVYIEAQLDSQFTLAGTLHHEITLTEGELKIRRKRIELLNREAALPSIQLFI